MHQPALTALKINEWIHPGATIRKTTRERGGIDMRPTSALTLNHRSLLLEMPLCVINSVASAQEKADKVAERACVPSVNLPASRQV